MLSSNKIAGLFDHQHFRKKCIIFDYCKWKYSSNKGSLSDYSFWLSKKHVFFHNWLYYAPTNLIEEYFDHQYLWKENINVLDFFGWRHLPRKDSILNYYGWLCVARCAQSGLYFPRFPRGEFGSLGEVWSY